MKHSKLIKQVLIASSALLLIFPNLAQASTTVLNQSNSGSQTQTKVNVSSNGSLSDMISQVAGSAPKPANQPQISVSNSGITVNGKFISNADFSKLLDKTTLNTDIPAFHVTSAGKLEFDVQPRFAAVLLLGVVPGFGEIALAVTGAILVGGVLIPQTGQLYNNIVSHLNSQQKAKIAATKKSKASQKERATDVPSWARGKRPKKGQNGKSFAKELMDAHYGPGKWKETSKEYSQLKKFGDRGGK